MKPIAYINIEKRTLEFAKNIKWHTPTVANLDRIPLFTKEALAQEKALQALHDENERLGLYKDVYAQPEQEPVAWRVSPRYEDSDGYFDFTDSKDTADTLQKRGWTITPLYTTPPQRKPLTDEDVERIVREARVGEHGIGYTIARAIEAAHDIKGKA